MFKTQQAPSPILILKVGIGTAPRCFDAQVYMFYYIETNKTFNSSHFLGMVLLKLWRSLKRNEMKGQIYVKKSCTHAVFFLEITGSCSGEQSTWSLILLEFCVWEVSQDAVPPQPRKAYYFWKGHCLINKLLMILSPPKKKRKGGTSEWGLYFGVRILLLLKNIRLCSNVQVDLRTP